jgi:hypothetical protein
MDKVTAQPQPHRALFVLPSGPLVAFDSVDEFSTTVLTDGLVPSSGGVDIATEGGA